MSDLVPSTALAHSDLLGLAFDDMGEATVKLYRGDWGRFLEWADIDAGTFFRLHKADAAVTVSRYLKHLKHKGRKPATRSRARQALCSVVARLYAADAIPWSLAGLVQTPKVRRYVNIEALSHEGWLALLNAALGAPDGDGEAPAPEGQRDAAEPPDGPTDSRRRRDVAILLLLHDSALRRREVATLRPEDYDREAPAVWVWGKNLEEGDRESIPLNARQVDALDAWCAVRPDVVEALFTSIDSDAPIDGDGVNYVVRYWCRKAKIPEVGPHQLRHCAITQLAREEAPPSLLQRFARHESFDTTMHYIATTDGEVRKLTQQLGEESEDDDE